MDCLGNDYDILPRSCKCILIIWKVFCTSGAPISFMLNMRSIYSVNCVNRKARYYFVSAIKGFIPFQYSSILPIL